MAICKYCEFEMNGADGCVKMPVKTVGRDMDPIAYGSETRCEPPPLATGAMIAMRCRATITMWVETGKNVHAVMNN